MDIAIRMGVKLQTIITNFKPFYVMFTEEEGRTVVYLEGSIVHSDINPDFQLNNKMCYNFHRY